VRLGAQWCYLAIEDLPLRATAVRREGDALFVRLDDGRELPLPPAALWDEPGRGVRTQVPSRSTGRPLGVRFTNQAQMDLAAWIEEGPDEEPVLVLGSMRWPIPHEPPAP